MKKESKSASFYVAYVIKKLWALVALSLVVIAVTLSVVRYSLPYMNEQKHYLEDWLSAQVGTQIVIGEITAKWQGVGPAIVLRDVQLANNDKLPIKLSIAETAIEVDFWESILAKQIQSNKFDLNGLELTIDLASIEQEEAEAPIIDALEELFLQQLQLFSISNSKIIIDTPHDQQVVVIDQVSWVNKGLHHQGVGQLQIEDIAKNSASFILDLHGDEKELTGTFFAKGEEVDLSPWVEQWLVTPHELVESRGSFVMWATIGQQSVQSIQLDLSNSRFKWNTTQGEVTAAVLGGQISANPQQANWLFNLDNLTLQINDQVVVTNWLGKLDKTGSLVIQNKHSVSLAPILTLSPLLLDGAAVAFINSLQPEAKLNTFVMSRSVSGELAIKAALTDIQWQQTSMLPRMQGLNADLNWFNNEGKLAVKSKAGTLVIDKLLTHDIEYQRFFADFYFQTGQQGFSISSENALFKSDLVSFSPSLFYDSESDFLSFSAKLDAIDVTNLPKLYPIELMGQETRAYLIESLNSGTISSGDILWHGELSSFPFEQNQGVFQVGLEVKNGDFKFSPDWPALTELDVSVLFENQSLSLASTKGKLLDVDLTELAANIPTLSHAAVLTIEAKAQAQGPQVTELMLQSSLADTLGLTLQKVQVRGALRTDLNLHIPLTGKGVVVEGQAYLSKNQVSIVDLGLTLEKAKGKIQFVNDEINFKGLNALLLQQKVAVDFSGSQQEQGYQTDIKVNGDWQITPLLEKNYPDVMPYLSGQSVWSAQVALTLLTNGYVYNAEITTNLKDLVSTLPTPFAKNSGRLLPLKVSSQGNQQASSVKVTLGDEVQFNGNLPHQDMQFSRAHLDIGETDLVGMGLGFSISANLPELDISQWYQVIGSIITEETQQGTPLLEAPKRIFLDADNVLFAGQKLTDFNMVAKNTSDAWLLDVNAKQARMEVVIYKDWLSKGINVNADYIQLTEWQTNDSENENLFVPERESMPPISFSCARCSYLDSQLGKIDINLSRSSTGMKIDNVRLNNGDGLFNGTGDWFLIKGKSSTRLKGEFSSSDFGAFLKGFNFDSGIKDSEASSKFDLSWQNAPYEFNFESLNGAVDWHLSDGYLTEVTDKGSRIFSLLSLESLVRKLTLDFRDVFAKGFFYDKIDGSFQVKNGVADTRDTVVDGGAGEITMRGYTDLTAKQLNYHIEFAPKVTSSLPVIVAWMVNPATALAALAIDQVLTSAKVISNIKFSLTGTLDDPVLTELGRDSKEVSLPARAKPEVAPKSQLLEQSLQQPVTIQVPDEDSING
ncbi:YhdP family protein [Paraglaciecola sp. L3A3]|uniref:YhdP family protein n=1 Tax=Paraglaciecola sp. L3A3 TaxID=2686358 RepID=UPI001E2F2698|nr:YhdP family protein [Paraglaciecola sp. L3A3]